MKRYIYITIFILWTIAAISQNRIQNNGQDLFLNGINLAWMDFANDLTVFNEDLFAYVLDEISTADGNCIRWWLHTDGTSSPSFINDSVAYITDYEIIAMYKGLDMAYERGMGIILCLWSFNMGIYKNPIVYLMHNNLILTIKLYNFIFFN